MDDDSPKNQCPAVLIVLDTGAAYYLGRLVTDPGTLAKIAKHSPISADEAVVWHPPTWASTSWRR